MNRRLPHFRLVSLGLVVVLQFVIVGLFMAGRSDRPHDAPLAIVAPPVVAAALADRTSDVDDPIFAPVPTADRAEAIEDLEAGDVVGVVEVDLTADADTLLLSAANGSTLDRAVAREARLFSGGLGRTLDVEYVESAALDRRVAYVTVLVSLVAGFALAAVPAWRHGRVDSATAGLRRFAGFTAFAGAIGLATAAAALSTGEAWWWGLLVATLVLVSSSFTQALTSLWGVFGLALGSAICVVTAISLLTFTSPYLLSGPWRLISPLLPHGAGIELGQDISVGGSGDPRDWLVLALYVGLAAATAVVARTTRQRTEKVSVTPPR